MVKIKLITPCIEETNKIEMNMENNEIERLHKLIYWAYFRGWSDVHYINKQMQGWRAFKVQFGLPEELGENGASKEYHEAHVKMLQMTDEQAGKILRLANRTNDYDMSLKFILSPQTKVEADKVIRKLESKIMKMDMETFQ